MIIKSSSLRSPPQEEGTSLSLLDLLAEQKILTLDQKKIVLKESRLSGLPIEAVIAQLGFVDPNVLHECLSSYEEIPIFNPDRHPPDQALLENISREECEHFKAIPFALEGSTLHAAVCDAVHLAAQIFLKERFSARRLSLYLTHDLDFHKTLNKFFPKETSIKDLLTLLENFHEKAGEENHCALFLETLMREAVTQGASDIHFEPEGRFVRVRYRLDGVLWQRLVFHQDFWPPLSVRLKILSDLDIAESRLPQNGRFSQRISGRVVDFRLSFHPTVHGENAVLRILDKHHSLIPLKHLGYTDDQYHSLLRLIREPQGLIIFTGPTGSGKSTSLYSLLQELNQETVNIMTLEEPVEFELPVVRQTEVREPGGVSFAKGIRSILRQDPDIILIAEIRDEETAQMAFRAATTGHLVLTTLHTIDALGALYRLQDLGISPHRLAGVVRGIVAQRLIRKKCLSCEDGCKICSHRGYRGRQALAEILLPDLSFEKMLTEGASYEVFRAWFASTGTLALRDHAQTLLNQGITDQKEISRVLGSLTHENR